MCCKCYLFGFKEYCAAKQEKVFSMTDGWKKKMGGIRSRYIAIPLFVPGVSAYDAVQFIFCCKLTLVHFLRILIVCKSQWEAWSIGCILETFAVLQVVDTLLSEHIHVHKKLTLACCISDWKKMRRKENMGCYYLFYCCFMHSFRAPITKCLGCSLCNEDKKTD